MADTTIEELVAATTLNDDDLLVVQQGDLAKKLSGKVLSDYICNKVNFVTPEAFGAKGDGITDDTLAWQAAVNSGMNVIATKDRYKCGVIEVRKNIIIDCNGANFLCTDLRLFNCLGKLVDTLTNQPDYSAGDKNYTLANSNYTGFAMMKGTNNFEQSRTYYYGGFVCSFYNGVLTSSYPIDVENVSVLLIDPITVEIKNLGNIVYTGTSLQNKYWIRIQWGLDCNINCFKTEVSDFYCVISLNQCLNCICRDLFILAKAGTVGTNSYVISLGDSSFCTIDNSHIYNKYWHCITTGINYLNYRNKITSCTLLNDTGYALDDHENGIGTIIKDSCIAGVVVGAQSILDNVTVLSMNNNYKSCLIVVATVTDRRLAGCTISNAKFLPDTDCTVCGILLNTYPQQSGKTFYYDNIFIENIRCENTSVSASVSFGFGSSNTPTKSFVVGKITFNHCDIPINLSCTNQYADLSEMIAKKAVYEDIL